MQLHHTILLLLSTFLSLSRCSPLVASRSLASAIHSLSIRSPARSYTPDHILATCCYATGQKNVWTEGHFWDLARKTCHLTIGFPNSHFLKTYGPPDVWVAICAKRIYVNKLEEVEHSTGLPIAWECYEYYDLAAELCSDDPLIAAN